MLLVQLVGNYIKVAGVSNSEESRIYRDKRRTAQAGPREQIKHEDREESLIFSDRLKVLSEITSSDESGATWSGTQPTCYDVTMKTSR